MDLILIVGPQAVGKMTVGRELEKRVNAKLLFNHETIDLFARFLNYTKETFRLSELVRRELFQSFVENEETNATEGIIFTVVIAFENETDWGVLRKWTDTFTQANGTVYFIELEAELDERLQRNIGEDRLIAKPSKRNIDFSKNELVNSAEKHRLNSNPKEVEEKLPVVKYKKIDNTTLSAIDTAEQIVEWMNQQEY